MVSGVQDAHQKGKAHTRTHEHRPRHLHALAQHTRILTLSPVQHVKNVLEVQHAADVGVAHNVAEKQAHARVLLRVGEAPRFQRFCDLFVAR